MSDPTRMREQPSLTTARGNIWLVVGGLFTAIALGVLIALTTVDGRGIALVAAIVVAVLYVGMVVVRFAVPAGRLRLGLLAGGMLAIAAVSLTAVLVVAGQQTLPAG